MGVFIEAEKCTGCARCLKDCPYDALEVIDGRAVMTERCTQCGACLSACPEGAIISDAAPRAVPDFKDYQGVFVLAEVRRGRLHPVGPELLGAARRLAERLGQRVGAVLLGQAVRDLAPELIGRGADEVHLIEDELLDNYLTGPHTRALAGLIRAEKPGVLLIGATHQGRDLAPRLARRLSLGLTADCTALEIDPEEKILLQTRPAFGGNVMATIASRYSRPQMATVRPGIMEALPLDPARRGRIVEHRADLGPADLGALLLREVRQAGPPVDLSRAKIIVAGGRGLGSAEGFKLLEDLARALGGQVGGSRAAVEAGWIGPERQIGQTGLTVRPELYLACGVSGAIQHRAGILDSRYIVAINRDPGAAIFEVADFGLVGDYKAIVPALIRAVQGA